MSLISDKFNESLYLEYIIDADKDYVLDELVSKLNTLLPKNYNSYYFIHNEEPSLVIEKNGIIIFEKIIKRRIIYSINNIEIYNGKTFSLDELEKEILKIK